MSVPPHILLVEDDHDQALLFSRVLEMVGYQVVTAATAEEGVTQLADAPFDLLLADWDLPGAMQGDALIALVRADFSGVKTVLFSNHAEVKTVAQACGADAWLRKYEGISRLREVVAELVPPQR